MASERFDAVVIGSGFGGSVAACRMAEAGLRVLVLERGRRWAIADYPRLPNDDWIFDVDHPERQHGWIDVRLFPRIGVLQGAGVGGGSLIYANVFVEPEQFAFEDGWPEAIGFNEIKPHLAVTGEMLAATPLPDGQLTARHRLMAEAAEATGARTRLRKLPLAVSFDDDWHEDLPNATDSGHSKSFVNRFGKVQGTCIHCGSCDLGCRVGARNTLDLNYLAQAEAKGCEIRPLHLVQCLAEAQSGYRVDYEVLGDGRRSPGSVEAEWVIIAAGSLGSTELLLRCRDQHRTLPEISHKLGHGWSANGDFLTPAIYPRRDVSPTRGPTITTAIDYLDGSDGGHRYFVEDGGFPDVVGNALRAMFGGTALMSGMLGAYDDAMRPLLAGRDPLTCIMPWFGQAADGPGGRMRLDHGLFPWDDPKLDLDYDVSSSRAVVQALIDRHETLSEATEGTAIEPIAWRLFNYLITPHPLGGCNMADRIEDGVVDHQGEVFNYPRLYVMDGATIPRALGLNPSRTIAALAERNTARMLA